MLRDVLLAPAGLHSSHLSILTKARKPNHRDILFCRYLLAVALTGSLQYREAERHIREALALAEQHLPRGHRTIIDMRIELGRLLADTGRALEADALLISAASEWKPSNGRPHYRTGEALTGRGACLLELGRVVEAESLLVRGHAMLLETVGAASPRTRRAARDLARLRDREEGTRESR